MKEFVYRFRPTKSLREFRELEDQVVYCASLAQLNDPMEGFKDMFWLGDKIVWANLLKHYLLCLDRVCIQFLLVGNRESLKPESMPVFDTENDLPSERYKDYFKAICIKFFGAQSVAEYLERLSALRRPVRRDELRCHLRALHFHALNSILETYKARGFMPESPGADAIREICTRIPANAEVFRFEEQYPEYSDSLDFMYVAAAAITTQFGLIGAIENPIDTVEKKNRNLILDAFLLRYIKMLEKIVHVDWHTACFSGDCASSTMWGHYADGHRGVCLKFATTEHGGTGCLNLYGITGWRLSRGEAESQPICGYGKYPLHKINYENAYPEIDFFRSLGRLRGVAVDWWYSDGAGNKSPCASDVYGDETEWRERY